ncbi:MAG: glycosyltransferase [Chromatiaceae bacterium]|jgi:exo-beta-1,3-glucanase (GH17 family)/cellulose synthase/poly-beta-1,6-N-acetylglucosamine synthase-like glycosyltransferase
MSRSSAFITVLMAGLAVLLWAVVNQPDIEPAWPAKVEGFSFSPMRGNENPMRKAFPTTAEIDEDLALLAGDAYAVRTYTVEGTLGEIPQLAKAHGLNVALGAWLGPYPKANEREIEKLIRVYRANYRDVVRVIVGNESILRGEQTVDQMISHLDRVHQSIWGPISTAEPWHVWLKYPQLVEHVDFIAVHLLPYWEGIPVDKAVDYVVARYEELARTYPDKPIVIAEVGWPSKGRTRHGAVASQANQAKFLRRFLAVAQREGYTYYLMEAFDQLWKRELEGEAGSYWGIYNADREPKFAFTAPVVRIPEWHGLAAISIGLSVIILALLFRDSSGLGSSGRGFLALVAYAITTFAVWMLYDFSQQYLTPATLAVGVMLFVAALGVIVVLLAEAHEWAEALWLKQWRRAPQRGIVADGELPMVSVHVPTYNEPPDMLVQTLDALAALDYPNYEVVVIDNNTKDPTVWQPVERHCEELRPRFRFIHVDPLAGFKAGALNFALRQTDPSADVVAVIDSDYLVEPNWLRELVPLFSDPNMAIVQAPQDYRDGDQNAFKAMCQAEFRGFFHIGMVTRNERNAIIQHGTMTLVRRRVLEEVEGWAEWCITEDAELGLRIFELGCAATYIPHSYGKGLMPDTFLDLKKQRFRWAYGAVLIMRHHISQLLGLEATKLTRGQRYHFLAGWLPWLADGFNLVFNLAAIGWSAAMVLDPADVAPPYVVFAVLPLALFFFKLAKMFFLYRRRVEATLRQSLAAGLTGLALSHVIARAMLTGFITRRIGFCRTPKRAPTNAVLRALLDCREELLFLVALLLAAAGVLGRPDGDMFDTQVWALVLSIQTLSYAAAASVAIVSGLPCLPASLIGPMRHLVQQLPLPQK